MLEISNGFRPWKLAPRHLRWSASIWVTWSDTSHVCKLWWRISNISHVSLGFPGHKLNMTDNLVAVANTHVAWTQYELTCVRVLKFRSTWILNIIQAVMMSLNFTLPSRREQRSRTRKIWFIYGVSKQIDKQPPFNHFLLDESQLLTTNSTKLLTWNLYQRRESPPNHADPSEVAISF